jgi:hypothetical protein
LAGHTALAADVRSGCWLSLLAYIAAWKVPSTYVCARARWIVRRRVAMRVGIERDRVGDMVGFVCEVR